MTEGSLTFTTDYEGIDVGAVVLNELTGREALSTLYEYEFRFQIEREGGLTSNDIDGLLAKPCFFTFGADGATVELHGVLRHLELIDPAEPTPVHYRAILVPRLWNTTRSFRSRVYQEMTVQDIVDEVLALSELEAEWHLKETYPENEYTVQYEETDFAFLSRLLEHYGLYYYFRQDPDGEVLVIADNNEQFKPLTGAAELLYTPKLGRSSAQGKVHSIRAAFAPQPQSLTVRDYNWRTPKLELKQDAAVDERTGLGSHWCYGDHFKDEEQGAQIATIRAEQLLNQRELYEGICSVSGLAPGHKFQLVGCPLPELNVTYLVTSVEPTINVIGEQGDEAREYRFTAVVLEREAPPPVPYRSQRLTPWPVITGFMHGFVDGEAPGTVAPIDEHGRYKIILPMDSVAAPGGGKASRWIRMAQASSGPNYGIHFPLHIGTEVAIIHLDGDPDRPVIMGSIPNPAPKSPVVQGEATMSRIRTPSGIEIEINDDV